MSGAAFKLEVSEGQIQNAIAVALAESFGPEKRDALFRDVIRAHLSQRENTYDKETLLSKRIGSMVRQMAEEALKAKMEELRPEIMRIVNKALGARFAESVYQQVSDALERVTVSSIRVTADLARDDED